MFCNPKQEMKSTIVIMFAVKPFAKRHANNSLNPNFNKLSRCAAPMILSNIFMTMPAHAEGKVFDFNATLPAMAVQFLLLMVFLEKTWFGPVGKVLDERDAKIRARLSSVKTGDDDLESLAAEAEKLLKDARAESQAKIADAKSVAAEKAAVELAAEKAKLDAELERSLKDLELEKNSAQANIDKQVAELSDYILKKVLPKGFSL